MTTLPCEWRCGDCLVNGAVVTTLCHKNGTVVTTLCHKNGTVVTTLCHVNGTVVTTLYHVNGTVVTTLCHKNGTVVTTLCHKNGTVVTTLCHVNGTMSSVPSLTGSISADCDWTCKCESKSIHKIHASYYFNDKQTREQQTYPEYLYKNQS